MIANFRVQADLKGMETTTDGRLDNHLYKIKQDIRIYIFSIAGQTAGPNGQTWVTGG